MPSRARRLQPDEIVELLLANQQGESMSGLARWFDVRRQTISELLQRNGIVARTQPAISKEQVAAAVKLYATGLSLAKVGDRLSFDAETIRQHLKRQGVVLRSPLTRP